MPPKKSTGQVQQWDIFELALEGPDTENPFTDINLTGEFTCNGRTIVQEGFYDGNGIYKIRVMPDIRELDVQDFQQSALMDGIRAFHVHKTFE